MIRVQREDFDPARETEALVGDDHSIGGVVTFTGLVREMADLGEGTEARINAMTLEHYPGMTEKMLARIEAEALDRWPLNASLIIHRYGDLEPGDRIVVAAADKAKEQIRHLFGDPGAGSGPAGRTGDNPVKRAGSGDEADSGNRTS